MNFSVLPPEINSALIFAGAGPEPMAAAATAWDGLAMELASAAAQIDAIVPRLLDGGYRPETPVAVVAFASWPQQRTLRGTLADIAARMHDAKITRTAVIVVGDVLTAEGFTDSYLYSVARHGRYAQ